jgi:hypothetical protein
MNFSLETGMAANHQINRLNRRLRSQSLGPVTTISDQALASLGSGLQSLVTWLRQAAQDRPLLTLLLSLKAGFAVARMGGRRRARG